MTLAFASNVGGTATLIGDPPKIIIASLAGLSVNDFLITDAPRHRLVGVLVVLCRIMFRKQLQGDPDKAATVMTSNRAARSRTLSWLAQSRRGRAGTVGFVLHSGAATWSRHPGAHSAGRMGRILISWVHPKMFWHRWSGRRCVLWRCS